MPSQEGRSKGAMQFLLPQALLAMLLLLPVGWLLSRSHRRAVSASKKFGARANSTMYFKIRFLFAGIFICSLAMVAARPYVTYQKSADILFVVDVSRSMLARHSCSEPTFLDRAKVVLGRTIDSLPQANIGIFAFDRFAFPVTQMTNDRDYLQDVVDNALYVGLMLQATQTEIANALNTVAEKMRRLPDIYGGVSHIVLLTDGYVDGNYRRRLAAAVAQLKGIGARVSAVGIGNPEDTPISDSEGGQCLNRKLEVSGDTVMIPLRTDVLKFVATESGGDYFSEYETDRLVESLRADLKRPVEGRQQTRARRDFSGVFLALASVALLGFVYLPILPWRVDE